MNEQQLIDAIVWNNLKLSAQEIIDWVVKDMEKKK